MALPLREVIYDRFNGGNWSDQPGALFNRAFQQAGGGFQQVFPFESPDQENIDFPERGTGKRKGSTLLSDISGDFVGSEVLIKIWNWTAPGTTTKIQVAVGVKSIYTDQATPGTFIQINDSASAAYTHSADVSKISFVEGDGHLFILIDGANKIQVYQSGADLDDELDNGNTYLDAKGGGGQTITGTWGTAYFMGFYLHGRLCFGKGDSIWEFTDTGQPWDLVGGGFYQSSSNIVAVTTFIPQGGNELNTVGFLSTTGGPEFVPGFDLTDTSKPMQGGGTALNYQCITTIDNWIVYMTSEGGLEGVNYAQTIDLGRRYKTLDGTSGPLDTFSPTNSKHPTLPFVFNNREKKQPMWFYPDSTNTTNSHAVVLDFYLGEPVLGDSKRTFEADVRCLYWLIKDPSTNPWFVNIYQKLGAVVGVLATGITYTLESGKDDLDNIAVEAFWEKPDFDGGASDNLKFWRRFAPTFRERGDWNVTKREYLDYASTQTGEDFEFSQIASSTVWGASTWDGGTWAGVATINRSHWRELNSRAIRERLFNNNSGEDFVLLKVTEQYSIGSIQD